MAITGGVVDHLVTLESDFLSVAIILPAFGPSATLT